MGRRAGAHAVGQWQARGKNGHVSERDGFDYPRRLTNPAESEAVKMNGSGHACFDAGFTRFPGTSTRRKAASAQIAKIPLTLAQHIARAYKLAA
jgi:hypothetical protein